MDQAPDTARADSESRKLRFVTSMPFFLVHVLAVVGVVWLGWSWKWFGVAVASYYFRMFFVTGGYHRYFSHQTYKTSRVFQFLLAFFAQTSTQKGALWWAGHHRIHHKLSDKPGDIHSMKLEGFWWSHVGWILSTKHEETEWDQIPEFKKYPELRFLNHWHVLPTVIFATTLWLVGSWHALVWGYLVSTVLLWHGTFTINSLSHWLGRRRYATTDESRNSLTLAIVTMGEGWHNNHHYYPRATNQGFFWWEIDATYYILRALSVVGIVWDLQTPPKKIRDRVSVVRRPRAAREAAASAIASVTAPVTEATASAMQSLEAPINPAPAE